MKRYRINNLDSNGPETVISSLLPNARLAKGGLSFHKPGQRVHEAEPVHVHTGYEVFCIMQGRGHIELDNVVEAVTAGDVLVIEPGENHHLVSDTVHPLVNLWLHTE